VIDIDHVSGTAQKCTLCYDRTSVGLEPACSKACPTDSIQFGPIAELQQRAQQRVEHLQSQGESRAQLYGADRDGPLGGLNSFFLLVDEPEVYGLPREPKMPTRNLAPSAILSSLGAVVMTVIGALTLRARRLVRVAAEQVK
jgi:formate dehydrogenase iron-sulfur subunit